MSGVEQHGPKLGPRFVRGVDVPRIVRESGKQVGETAWWRGDRQSAVRAQDGSTYILFRDDAGRWAQFAATCGDVSECKDLI